MRHTTVLALAVVVLVMLAGCGGSDETTPTPTDTDISAETDSPTASPTASPTVSEAQSSPSPTPTSSPAETSTQTAESGTPGEVTWNFFEFERPGTYEYELRQANGETATMELNISSVSGDEVTVGTVFRTGEQTFRQEITGTQEQVRAQLMQSPVGGMVALGLFNPALMGIQMAGQFQEGASWEYTADGQTLRYEVTSQDTYAGVGCYLIEVSVDGQTQGEFCVSPDHGLSPYVAIYDEGSIQVELELVDYQSG